MGIGKKKKKRQLWKLDVEKVYFGISLTLDDVKRGLTPWPT